MERTFALPDGTCAGVKLPDGLSDHATDKVYVPCSDKDVSVVFYAANKQTLDRVMTRFATAER